MVEGVGSVNYDKIQNALQEVPIADEDWSAGRSATISTHGFRQFRLEVSGGFATPTDLELVAVSPLNPSLDSVSWSSLPTNVPVFSNLGPGAASASTLSTQVTERYSDYQYWKVRFTDDVTSASLSYLGKKGEGVKPSVKSALNEAADIDISGTIAQSVRVRKTGAGTVVSGPVSAGVAPGTIDVTGVDKFTLAMQARPSTGATISVENQIRGVPGGMWGSIDVVTVKESTPLVKTITDVAKDYRPVPQSAGTLDVEYRTIV